MNLSIIHNMSIHPPSIHHPSSLIHPFSILHLSSIHHPPSIPSPSTIFYPLIFHPSIHLPFILHNPSFIIHLFILHPSFLHPLSSIHSSILQNPSINPSTLHNLSMHPPSTIHPSILHKLFIHLSILHPLSFHPSTAPPSPYPSIHHPTFIDLLPPSRVLHQRTPFSPCLPSPWGAVRHKAGVLSAGRLWVWVCFFQTWGLHCGHRWPKSHSRVAVDLTCSGVQSWVSAPS